MRAGAQLFSKFLQFHTLSAVREAGRDQHLAFAILELAAVGNDAGLVGLVVVVGAGDQSASAEQDGEELRTADPRWRARRRDPRQRDRTPHACRQGLRRSQSTVNMDSPLRQGRVLALTHQRGCS